MNEADLRRAVSALKALSSHHGVLSKFEPYLDDAVSALDQQRSFNAVLKIANTASNIFDALAPDNETSRATSSISFHCYQYCVDRSRGTADISPSRDKLLDIVKRYGGPLDFETALTTIYEYLHPDLDSQNVAEDERYSSIQRTAAAHQFEEAVSVPIERRLSDYMVQWSDLDPNLSHESHRDTFVRRISSLLTAGETGRQFGDFSILDEDLRALEADLDALVVPGRAQEIQDRAKTCRNMATIDFGSADFTHFRTSRRCWLVSAFWNSALTDVWATNQDQFVYDILGYLTAIQAQHRYAIHEDQVLLLLRVSHLICRIASSDALVPTIFYEKFEGIESWVRYTAGTVLAISGPGRVPPSSLRNDPRLVDGAGRELNRDEFAAVLLPMWREPHEREAACAILLELAGWSLSGASRIVRSALRSDLSECELWWSALQSVVTRASDVKVLRPNPWARRTSGTLVTADEHALRVLASDVIHRTFPAIGTSISLNGTSFKSRRVPTFVCSADFGPLGLFKVDSRDRIEREEANFTRYAQMLHPRYRASRCDRSVAAISEPDDHIEFVSGLLTSYVFTDQESPRTLNEWIRVTPTDEVIRLIDELFVDALRPWYNHSIRGVLDVTSEYPLFTRQGLNRLEQGVQARDGLRTDFRASRSFDWLDSIVSWISGSTEAGTSPLVESQAAQLQLCDTYRSVTHGDLHLDNILVLGRPHAEYPCLIDFETSGEAHLLRDLGRFVSALLIRTHEWDEAERVDILRAVPRILLEPAYNVTDVSSDRLAANLHMVERVRDSYLSQWRAGMRPDDLEIVAVLVCSLLPYARYPDTSPVCANVAIDLADALVEQISLPSGA